MRMLIGVLPLLALQIQAVADSISILTREPVQHRVALSFCALITLFFIFLGCSAAVWGGWLEHAGPRKAGVVSALCWCGGLLISALGIYTHQIWLMWLGSGVIGGIGLGLGYISPVSTLIKWFPDKRGMATGMAIMGFGGGAMVGAPLAAALMNHFAGPDGVGVWQSFVAMATCELLPSISVSDLVQGSNDE